MARASKPRRTSRTSRTSRSPRRWSQRVTETSDALSLESRVFAKSDPKAIARSLKRSAETSRRRKAGAFGSAMSMLTFYVNRAGRNLPASRKRTLMKAKDELRALYGKEKPRRRASKRRA